ncbi:MAG TPA: hypothetical protein PKE64_18615 [Anaerolineae bacterium]|nr:hypothetical protein [Anaerolineae bacterium]HMR66027.1 hypothetical protein [Anaerolineae bacterium]
MPRAKKNINYVACLESLWDDGIIENDQRANVVPILELLSKNVEDFKFSHLTCNTRGELEYNLEALKKLKKKKQYGILYLSFHGEPGYIHLADETKISLEELADLFGQRFSDWVIHFGSCGTVDVEKERLTQFVEATQVLLVSGYTQSVDWIESAAMDLLFFSYLLHYIDMKAMWKSLHSRSESLIKATGLVINYGK